MPKFHPTVLIQDCWSSIGNITFYHRNDQCFWKRKPQPTFNHTPARLDQAQVHHRAILAWQQLPHSVQLEWRELAKSVPSHQPPYDNHHHISGYNLFVSAYHGFATLGDEHCPTPKPYESCPPHSVAFLDASLIDATSLQLRFKTFFPDGIQASRYQILMKVQLAKPGYGKKPGLMRNFLATAPCSNGEGVASFQINDFIARWGLDLAEYQVHCKYVLLDRETGYRNIHSPLSFLIKLR